MDSFSVGDIVVVDNPELRSNGYIGKIIKLSTKFTAVVVFDYLPWCFRPNPTLIINLMNLAKCNEERNYEERNEVTDMVNKRTLGIRADEPFKVVKVRFLEGHNVDRCYSYATFIDVGVGDKVVVKSANHGLGIADVVEIVEHPTEADITFVCEGREIVDKFTMEYYNNRVEFRKQVIADEQRKAELKRQMRKLAMEDNELVMFAKMAELNPTMKALLDEFNSIGTKSMADENEN